MRRSHIARLALGLALVPAACDNGPIDPGSPDDVGVRVEFSLSVTTSAGLDLCQQTDLATLTIRQGGRVRTETVRPQGDPDCVAEFDVTVKKGMVEFTGELLGNDRPLMRGFGELEALADGFSLSIPLEEIPALTVVTRTQGTGGPPSFRFTVDGGDTISIGRNSVRTVGGIAAGSRTVELLTLFSCNPFREQVGVEVASQPTTLAIAEFDIDCGTVFRRGTIAVVTTTTGGPPTPSTYQVRIDSVRLRMGANDRLTHEVDIGQRTVEFAGHEGFDNCDLREPSRTTVPVDSAKTSIVRFTVDCDTTPPPTPKIGGIRIVTRTFGPATPPVKYAVTITAANTNPITVFLPPNDSTDVSPLLTENNPYTVFLATTKSCEVRGSPSVAVTVPAGGLARVVFTIDCPPKSPSQAPRVPALEPPAPSADSRHPPSSDAARESPAPSRTRSR